jgi:ADP-L-glycero-D-manno-heptose 6-epimerase
VVDNLASSEKWKNLVGKRFRDYMHKDELLNALESKHALPDRIEAVVHLGACSSTTETNAEYMMRNNFHYSQQLAEWAALKKIRFLYASSGAVYGDGLAGFDDAHEQSESYRPLNVYGYSKQLFDNWLIATGLIKQVAGLRFFNVYGPNEYHKGDMASVVFKAYHQIQQTGSMRLFRSDNSAYGDGEQKRDFVSVKDCVEVMLWLLEQPQVNGVFNLGTGKAESWNTLAAALFKALERKRSVEYVDMPTHLKGRYQYFTEAKIDRLRAAGYSRPFLSLEEGVSDYVRNYLSQPVPYW